MKTTRNHIIQLLEYTDDGWNKTISFRTPDDKIEIIPVGFIIQMQSDHVEHHLKRILDIRKEVFSK